MVTCSHHPPGVYEDGATSYHARGNSSIRRRGGLGFAAGVRGQWCCTTNCRPCTNCRRRQFVLLLPFPIFNLTDDNLCRQNETVLHKLSSLAQIDVCQSPSSSYRDNDDYKDDDDDDDDDNTNNQCWGNRSRPRTHTHHMHAHPPPPPTYTHIHHTL